MWHRKAVATSIIYKTCFLMRFIVLGILFRSLADSTVGTNAYSTDDFLMPPDWFAHGLGNSGGVGNNGSVEPINVIISAQSTVDPFLLLTTLFSWSSCYVSTLQANVQPGQQDPVNQLTGLREGGCIQFAAGGNHMRAWSQTLPDGTTAYFIAASTEHGCRSDGGKSIIPWPIWNWHCIDPDGFNQGRDGLTSVFVVGANIYSALFSVEVESAQLYDPGTGTDAGEGSNVDHIPYDGVVDILTILGPNL